MEFTCAKKKNFKNRKTISMKVFTTVLHFLIKMSMIISVNLHFFPGAVPYSLTCCLPTFRYPSFSPERVPVTDVSLVFSTEPGA